MRSRRVRVASRSAGGNALGVVTPATYSDYDEAMNDGVELEEKGERFQFGPKAQRFYQQAAALYSRAAQLATSPSHSADAYYNASRIHFLLGTQFLLPPDNVAALAEAVIVCRRALALALPLPQDGAGEMADPFTLDILTHLATSIQSLAELVDELGWPSDGLQSSLGDYSHFAQHDDSTPILASPVKLWHEAISFFRLAAKGQQAILEDQGAQPSVDSTTSVGEQMTAEVAGPSADAEVEDQVTHVGTPSKAEVVYGYTSSLVTTSSLLDTLLSLLACFTSLIEASKSAAQVDPCSVTAQELLVRAESLFSIDSLPAIDPSEASGKRQELLRSQLVLRTASVTKAVEFAETLQSADSALTLEIKALIEHVLEWAKRLLDPPISAASAMATTITGGGKTTSMDMATLCDVAEAGQTLCRLSLRLVSLPSTTAQPPDISTIWTLATVSTKLFSSALSALDTSAAGTGRGTAAVLGQSNISTPSSRARCRILLALSATSLLRANSVFEQAAIAGAMGTRSKLVNNARAYVRKAVTEIGLGWLLRPSNSASGFASASGTAPPPGGWESLSLESEAVFSLLRVLLFRFKINRDATTTGELQAELSTCTAHLAALRRKPIDGSANLAEWLFGHAAKSFVDQLVDENGKYVSAEELDWWQELLGRA